MATVTCKILRVSRRACENYAPALTVVHLSPRRAAHSHGSSGVAGWTSQAARYRIDFYRKCKCARRARGQYAPLGTRREVNPRIAHRRVSFLGSSGLLPTAARRRLCSWGGVPGSQRTMGCLILKTLDVFGRRIGGDRWKKGKTVN